MTETNDVLIKILEELKINGTEFQSQIVMGELIQAGALFAFNLILLIVAIKFFKEINQELYLKENLIQIFSIMKNYKNVENADYKKKKEQEDKPEFDDALKEMWYDFKTWCNKAPINRICITLLMVYIEVKVFFFFANNMIHNLTIVINCFVASEKVVLDYLANLF